MAITMDIRNNETKKTENRTIYVDAVLETREENGYHDSDFYALVWDDEEERIKRVDYDTTRFAGGGSATVDATPEVIRKAEAYLRGVIFDRLFAADRENAAKVEKGKRVRVVRGRKVAHGTEGLIFYWSERTYSPRFRNGYKQGPDTIKIGIAIDDTRDESGRYVNVAWTYAKNVEVIHPEQYHTDEDVLRNRATEAAARHSWASIFALPTGFVRL